MILRAPAKVNLCLRVGPLRKDGYHRLTTLFQAAGSLDCEIGRVISKSVPQPAQRYS